MQIVSEISSYNSLKKRLKEIAQFKELLYFFAWKDIRVKYKQAFLGFAWAVLQPFLLMLVFTMLAKAISLKTENIPYPVYAFAGIIFWNIFATSVQSAGNAVVSNAHIIKKIFFPKLFLPISSVIVSIFDFLVALLVLFALIIYYYPITSISWNALYLIPALVLVAITSIGAGVFFSALNVKYRDFKYIIPFIIQLGFFASPIIYQPLSFDNDIANFFYNTNPFVASMALIRYACFNISFSTEILIPGIVSSIFILIIGFFVFFKMEKNFADIA